jgi:hypothetical protein
MKWKIVTARTTKINRSATTPRHGLEHYCRDLNGWPRSWMGLEKDLPPGEQLVTLFRPFLEQLAASNLSPKTIQKHVDNIWVLGGEFITELNYTPSLRKAPVEKVLADMIKGRRPHSPSRQLRGTTAILRVHLPKALEILQSITRLNLGQITHRFLRRGEKKTH